MRLAEIVQHVQLRVSALDLELSDPAEVTKVINFLAGKVPSMDDKSVAFGFYCSLGIPKEMYGTQKAKWANTLRKPLTLEYRKRMLEWFKYALVKRANMGAGGSGIKAVEAALYAFLEYIPQLLTMGPNAQFDLRAFLADKEKSLSRSKSKDDLSQNKYLDTGALTGVGRKILSVLFKDADREGLFQRSRAAAMIRMGKFNFPVVWDRKGKIWFIPRTPKTFPVKDQIQGYGFRYNPGLKRYEIVNLTPLIQRDFQVEQTGTGATGEQASLEEWFWNTWYPKNHARFTKVFSDYARNLQSSYQLIFPKTRKGKVKFKRNIESPEDAIEELRFRYIGRQGREPWLLVMDLFLDLDRKSSAGKDLEHLIDRMNGLQHSNGLFLEQFPANVVSWYKGFLNAKYHSPDAGTLAKYIPDRDLKEAFMFLADAGSGKAKPVSKDQWEQLPEQYHEMGKDESEDKGPNWREKNYPRKPGADQPDRFSEEVQRGLGRTFLSDLWRERAKKER
jgi:hypothetical protein